MDLGIDENARLTQAPEPLNSSGCCPHGTVGVDSVLWNSGHSRKASHVLISIDQGGVSPGKNTNQGGTMYGAEWNFLAFVLSGIAFSYGLLLYAFAQRPIGRFLNRSKTTFERGSRVRAEEQNGITVFSLSEA